MLIFNIEGDIILLRKNINRDETNMNSNISKHVYLIPNNNCYKIQIKIWNYTHQIWHLIPIGFYKTKVRALIIIDDLIQNNKYLEIEEHHNNPKKYKIQIDCPNIPGVYRITNNINKKSYIGSSLKLRNRISIHFNNQQQRFISQDMQIFGNHNFSYEILYSENSRRDYLFLKEYENIIKYDTFIPFGYNVLTPSHCQINYINLAAKAKAVGMSDIGDSLMNLFVNNLDKDMCYLEKLVFKIQVNNILSEILRDSSGI